MSKCVSSVFQDMSGCGVLGVKIKQTETGGARRLPAAQIITYHHRDDASVEGHFILGFTEIETAVATADSIGQKMGLPPITAFNDLAVDVLNEFLNTWVGHTISAWERVGMPVVFGPPSSLRQADLKVVDGFTNENFTIVMDLAFSKIILGVSFSEPEGLASQTKKILVVEDSGVIRSIVGQTLTEAGFEVSQAADGQEGVDRYRQVKPDLVIMDLVMPNMGGLDAMAAIREFSPEAKFIVLTSSSRTDEVMTAKTIGVSAYLIKPFQGDALLKRVNQIFSK